LAALSEGADIGEKEFPPLDDDLFAAAAPLTGRNAPMVPKRDEATNKRLAITGFNARITALLVWQQ
jgi:hypothetical protein